MKRFAVAFLTVLPGLLSAATGTVAGTVTDIENKPVEFAVVTLLSAADSLLVKGSVTSSDGSFLLEPVAPGTYFAEINLTGYKKKTVPGIIVGDGAQVTLPAILLESSEQLEGVTITAAQPLFVQKPGMLVMNVENSPVKLSGTAWELLQKAPGVFIDQNGNISLKGKAGVRVYIDGKNTFLSGEQLQNYLQAMPAAGVVKIEIISNPSAKYDAEGNAGIINIVTQKGSRQGFNGSVYGGGTRGKLTRTFAGFNFNYGKPKYNIYGKYDFGTPRRIEDHRVYKSITYENNTTDFDQRTLMTLRPYVHVARFGIDFTPGPRTTWGLRVDGVRDAENIWTDNLSILTPRDTGSTLYLNQQNHLRGRFMNGGSGIYLTHKLDTAGKEISASFDYLRYYDRTNETYDVVPLDVDGHPNGSAMYQRSQSNNDINIFVGQVDYTQPIGKVKFETGLKSSYVKTANELVFEIQNGSAWDYDSTRSNVFTYIEQINAAYVNGSVSVKKWEIMAGLRAEHTNSQGISPTMQQEVKRNYLEFFPSVFLTNVINENHTVSYAISRRINRPAYGELNPFLFYLDQYTYKAGNPFLQPEIAWNADLNYSYKGFLFVNASVSRRNGGMTDISRQEDSTGIIYQTTVNLNTVDMAYLGISVSHNITKWWINESNIGATYGRFRSNLFGTSFDNANTSFNIDATETFLLPKGYKIQVSGWYASTAYYGIFIFHPRGSVDASISKNFFNNTLQCSINFRDIFRTQALNIHVNFSDQDIRVHHIPDSHTITARVRYNFGNAKAARKSQFKSGADDLKERAG
jgi:iron complex outermembrane recepter protein